MNRKHGISVLMSVYKNETAGNLERSLESIWDKQTLKPDQVIVVRDGPLTVELNNVLTRWQSKLGDVMVCPENERNMGLAAALNHGLKYVECDLVARMDSDDYSAPDRFLLQHSYMNENPDVDVVGGSMCEIGRDGVVLGIRSYPKSGFRKYISKASPLAHATCMMRSSLFLDYGLRYDLRYPMNEDIALWFDMLRLGCNFANIEDVVYFCSMGDAVSQRRGRKKAWPEFRVYMRGIRDLFGILTWRYIYPVSRFIFRMMPAAFATKIYGGGLRQTFLKK